MFTGKMKLLKLKKNFKELLAAKGVDMVAVAGMAFASAAAAAVPVWTGYTRSIWVGVQEQLQQMSPVAFATDFAPIVVGGQPWFYPKWPASPHSDRIYEYPEEQQARGRADAEVSWDIKPASVTLHIGLPQYQGEQNYAIREEQWRSFAAGEVAFHQRMQQLLHWEAFYNDLLEVVEVSIG